ncbi:MAG: nucleoside-diphosphate sugar epimerase/dehydratase [Anaerostipes sp.]|nr:nucleoside-diphosphate sugar epimerase/dehydratase [Anaerostipes sp.]
MIGYIKRKRGAIILFIADVVIVILSSYMALLARFEFFPSRIDPEMLKAVVCYLPLNLFCTLVLFMAYRLYSRLWRLSGVNDFVDLIKAAFLAVMFQFIGINLLNWYIPRSFPVIYGIFFIILSFLTRFVLRMTKPKNSGIEKTLYRREIPVMIIGAGEAGNLMAREIQESGYLHKKVLCIIDDDANKKGTLLAGIPVVGGREQIVRAALRYEIEEIIFAIPSMDTQNRKKILEICKETQCKMSTLPGIYQLINSEVTVSKIRKVKIEDLLGRDVVRTNMNLIMDYVKDRCVLVTGGGGSIGSELCRQIVDNKPKQLIILDNYENNVYNLQMELQRNHSNIDIKILIATVQNQVRIHSIFEKYKPDIVFHAAAHKHVPLMEDSPCDAIRNNVFGTLNVVKEADLLGVKKMVMISTDKAVRPTNIMGASKRICEMIIQSYNEHSNTEFVAVRFGNVLGSNGSVVPLFRKQIEEGGPVTVTHPDIIRYFMTIPEAVSLVLQAGAYAKGGEIFILDMGEPVKILDLAKNMIRLSGLILGEDIQIEYTGLRPGEKLYEELLIDESNQDKTENQRIFIGHPMKLNEDELNEMLEELREAAFSESDDIRRIVKKIVPEYTIKARR